MLLERTMVSGLHEFLINLMPESITYNTAILDIGCGTGAWLERLANAGFNNLYGIDNDIEQLQTKKATCWQANIDSDDLGFGNKKFGLITSIEVIEHLENPGRFFQHLVGLLAPEGYLLITTPNLHSVLCRLRLLLTGNLRQFDQKGEPTHIYPVFMTPLNRILKSYNFEIVYKCTYPSKGSVTSRPSLKMMSSLLSLILQDELPGDILCLLIQKINVKAVNKLSSL